MMVRKLALALGAAVTVFGAAACQSSTSGATQPQQLGETSSTSQSPITPAPSGAASQPPSSTSAASHAPTSAHITGSASLHPTTRHSTSTPRPAPSSTTSRPVPPPTSSADCIHHVTIDQGTARCGIGEPHPPGTTALCHDGTYSYSTTPQGTCSYHHGVAVWYY